MAGLNMRKAHEKGHERTVLTLHRSRKEVWIIGGHALAKSVRAGCTECHLKESKCIEERMDHRVGPSSTFRSIAVHLFGPIEYQGTVNKRQVGKGWGVMFVCTATLAVHVEFMDTYLTDSFLMAMQRFMCLRGTPRRIQSDRGKQLVAASKQMKVWDFSGIQEWAGKGA
jgi:hypothetical protein